MKFLRWLASSSSGAWVGFALLTVALTWPLATHLSTHTADIGVDDPLFYTRMVRHFLAWLSGQRTGLLDVDFFWPHPKALTTNDVSLGLLYGALPFVPFTSDLLTLVNLGFLWTFVLTGHATWLLVREWTKSIPAAWVGGAAFTFCLFRFAQFDHQNVLQMQWGVYALYALAVLQRRPGFVPALGLVVALFLHGTASMNIALYSVFALLMLGIYFLVSCAKEQRLQFLAWASAACVVTGLALSPIYRPYLEARERTGMKRELPEIQSYSGNILQLSAAPSLNQLYGLTRARFLGPESMTFPGVTVLLLASLGVALTLLSEMKDKESQHRNRKWVIAGCLAVFALAFGAIFSREVALVLVLAMFVTSLLLSVRGWTKAGWVAVLLSVALFYLYASFGPFVRWGEATLGQGMWEWVMKVPGFTWVRTPARFIFETSFALAILAAFGVARGLERWTSRRSLVLMSVLPLLAVLVEFNAAPMRLRKMRTLDEAPEVYTWLAAQPGKGAVLELPAFHLFERYRMYFSTLHQRPTVDGESGYLPPVMRDLSYSAFFTGSAIRTLHRLRTVGVEFVVLHKGDSREWTGRFEGALQQVGGRLEKTFGDDELWRMPVESQVFPFTQEFAKVTVSNVRKNAEGLSVTVQLASLENRAVFEYKERQLHLSVKENPSWKGRMYLSPPWLSPGFIETQEVVLRGKTDAVPNPCTLELRDETGLVWEVASCAAPSP